MNPEVDFFFNKAGRWQEAYKKLRTILLDSGLNEELKWGCPCYTYQGNNIVLIHGFKAYCALLFHKGALLEDTRHILVQQTKNVQSARQIRFTNVTDIIDMTPVLNAYIHEAIEVEKAGLKVPFKKTSDLSVPDEFREKLDKDPALRAAFDALTPGRQRGYLLFFSGAKKSVTRASRIEKYIPMILKGKGLHDR